MHLFVPTPPSCDAARGFELVQVHLSIHGVVQQVSNHRPIFADAVEQINRFSASNGSRISLAYAKTGGQRPWFRSLTARLHGGYLSEGGTVNPPVPLQRNPRIDGIPATLPDGQATLDHLDLSSLGRVEALRGPNAALYGNAAGGVLQSHPDPCGFDRLDEVVPRLGHGIFLLLFQVRQNPCLD